MGNWFSAPRKDNTAELLRAAAERKRRYEEAQQKFAHYCATIETDVLPAAHKNFETVEVDLKTFLENTNPETMDKNKFNEIVKEKWECYNNSLRSYYQLLSGLRKKKDHYFTIKHEVQLKNEGTELENDLTLTTSLHFNETYTKELSEAITRRGIEETNLVDRTNVITTDLNRIGTPFSFLQRDKDYDIADDTGIFDEDIDFDPDIKV